MTVYLIRAGDEGPVKIGWAADVEARRKQLQASNPEKLLIIRVIEGSRAIERWLHEHFASARLVGEWFTFDVAMLEIEPPESQGPAVPWVERRRLPRVSWAADRCQKGKPCPLCLERAA